MTISLERSAAPEGGSTPRSGARAGGAAFEDEIPTGSVDDARAASPPPRSPRARNLPPDIITLELELGAPLPGPETVGHDGPGSSPQALVRRRLGRFLVLGVLGRGAMGTVLEAYDDTLARTVALKLLHGRVDELRRDRLLREAQALAQLSHPNVVQVYEVGLVEDQMFIAMELVEGQTLRKWQRQRRPWREVVGAYLQAGRGLSAAHARGLVHRDFKPENCIIGDNGRVRVLDFGLARGSKTFDEPTRPLVSLESSALQLRMTQSGKVLGTLSYLPLQQLMGRTADARSDQFSFCVSLYEALYGVLPFPDHSMDALLSAQRAGQLQPVPRGHRVPRRLRRLLLRGLALRPEERWPSMDALLAALDRLQQPRRWPVAATLVVGFGAGAVVFAGAGAEDPCADARAALEGTWGASDRAAVEQAYLASGHEEAPRLFARVAAELDAHSGAWVRMHEESCRATFVRHEQPEAVFEQTMSCLQRHRGRLRATIDALSDVSTAADALERTALPFKLPGLAACAEPGAASEPSLALPPEPEQRERVLALRREIDRANTLADAGTMGLAVDTALAVVEEARGVGHEAVLAEALETLGRLQAMSGAAPAAEATLQEAIGVAARARDDTMAARAWSSLIYAVMLKNELDRGLALRFAALAAVDRADDPVSRAWLLNNLGALYGQRGEHDAAREHFQQALAVKQEIVGAEHLDTGIAWINLGLALKEARRLDEAAQALEHAHEIVMSTVGESHLTMAFVETGLGHVRQLQHDFPRAIGHHRRALEIRERALGPHHVLVARSLENLAKTELWQGELDAAVEHERRALVLYEREGGAGSDAKVGLSCVWLAEAEIRRGRVDEARALAERALGLLGPAAQRPQERARANFVMARALEHEPAELSRARAFAEQALDGFGGTERAEVEAWLRQHPLPGSPHVVERGR